VIRDARLADADALARLHAQSLPTSLLTELGHDALVRYYRFAIGSSPEHVWVATDAEPRAGEGAVIGGCVLSDDPSGVMKRFVRFGPLYFAGDLGRAMIASGSLRRRLVQGLRGGSDGGHKPEVTQIFTDAKRRGEGLGAQLLRTCEATLSQRGTRKYFVHTQRDDNEAGIRFYRREGFEVIGESRSFGEAFLVMQKELD
jgi:ribosomal protein S18 acetylase RimI-like enzyme